MVLPVDSGTSLSAAGEDKHQFFRFAKQRSYLRVLGMGPDDVPVLPTRSGEGKEEFKWRHWRGQRLFMNARALARSDVAKGLKANSCEGSEYAPLRPPVLVERRRQAPS